MIFLMSLLSLLLHASPLEESPRFIVHLLDYIAMDYPGAVENGKIKSDSEYKEQMEFVENAVTLGMKLPELKSHPAVIQELQGLKSAIEKKSAAAEIARLSRKIEGELIQIGNIEVAPVRSPSLQKGHTLYEQNCAQCHGVNGHGDGPAAPRYDPRPANFYEAKMDNFPPFQAFNAIRLGVPGTAMVPFTDLTDEEVWDLAFYVISLRHEKLIDPLAFSIVPGLNFSLTQLATQSDAKLREQIPGTPRQKAQMLAQIRLKTKSDIQQNLETLSVARGKLQEALAAVRSQDFKTARQLVVAAYLEGIEPAEPRLRAVNPELVSIIEQKMGELRTQMDPNVPASQIDNAFEEAFVLITSAEKNLRPGAISFGFLFTMSMGIVLREAFEAVLLLIMLLGVIRSIGSKKAAMAVHAGWILALVLAGLAWIFSGWLMALSGLGREWLEGAISLFAVFVLLYFGLWLHRKLEIGKWKLFISDLVEKSMKGKGLFALGAASFFAVFREGFETVLFLRAMLLESGNHGGSAIGLGVLAALAIAFVATVIIVRFSVRLPLRQLFSVSSALMLFLAFILLGKSIHSFQELGYIGVTPSPISLRLDLFGIYPTVQTLMFQVLLLVALAVFWIFSRRKSAFQQSQ